MYEKVRTRLTVLFSTVTCTLLFTALIISFLASEKAQYSLFLSQFGRQSSAVLNEIDEHTILTTDWMTAKEDAGSFHLFLTIQNVAAFHNSSHSSRLQSLFEQFSNGISAVSEESKETTDFAASKSTQKSSLIVKQQSENPSLYVGYRSFFPVALMSQEELQKDNGLLCISVLQPLDALYDKAKSLLLTYLLLFFIAGCFLVLFCRHFTGCLLHPLKENQENQNRFLSAASHELRTPLAVILTNASACRKAPPENQAAFFDVIQREGSQMSEMLEQLLVLSRADGHSLSLHKEPADLQTLLLNLYESFLPLAQESGHKIQILLPSQDIPMYFCDSSRIEQICKIFLQNAFSYTPAGCRIILSLSCGEKWFEISVQDNGPGIPDEEKERIFQRFHRISHNTIQKGHHGLGLAVAKELALAHGAVLSVHDAPDQGSVFTLHCPADVIFPSP